MKNQATGSLADKIAGILNTAPSSFDPEEDPVDGTNAQVSHEDAEDVSEEEILSKFRRKNIDLLADVDEKYAGRKTSRKGLRESSDEDEIANKMPHSDKFNEIKQESGAEFSSRISETKISLCGTLDKLLSLQKVLLKQYPETKNLDKETKKNSTDNDEDEEIPSDTDPEESKQQEETTPIKTLKKRKLADYESEIHEQHMKYKDYRNKVIQKWNDKTRVILKGGATSHSILDQIEYNLSNKDKLIKRTQQKRSQYAIVGENEETGEEYNTEIFDDDDFYHQLLRELIEVKSADVTDPVQLGRQWIQLQNLRSKMKRKVDTKATKGRRIRYAIHNKLVNFMAPIDEELWTDEAKTELYNSLFGKNQPVIDV
ncbi:AATF [Asbolus verrucosus]|uniref:AATF n=1 Tax=Asbolus verrucosus TaxID=1661398 RepID=A0A482WAM3_ASBVE|nr:AATF [Asbolus verrucosus]